MFDREKYYSQTEVVKKYKISIKKFKELIESNKIPQINKKVNLGMYEVTTIYILKEDIDSLNLTTRH